MVADDSIAPFKARRELFKARYENSRFKINETDDASEALETILKHFHIHSEK